MTARSGTIYLVGAGPGEPGLITVRGRQILESADVIVHDRLISARLLECVRADAQIEDVGKLPGRENRPQNEINQLLVTLARDGRSVCRLKGGDPFVFGRGGEEVLAARAAGVPVEVIPGVTSAVAAPTAGGVPVTHRGVSSVITIVTGHDAPCIDSGGVDWDWVAEAPGTIVVLMGLANLRAICDALIRAGRPTNEPVQVIEAATFPEQRMVTGTLDTIGSIVRDAGISNPATIVIGFVVTALKVEDRS
jgi:uroporphyrin-III C-methyltransferase